MGCANRTNIGKREASGFTSQVFYIMGKYIGYAIIIFLILLILECFEIVDIPFLEIPDFTAGKKEMIHKTMEALD